VNALKSLGLSVLLLLTAVSAAAAAPAVGTAKARGVYNTGGWESTGTGRARSSYSYRAPATYIAPVVRAADAPQVAQAPVEGRRFSYAPSAPVVSGNTCSPVQAPANTVDNGRRYSYAPGVESTVAPSVSSPTYHARPNYSARSGSGGNVDRWALPKTDPRKYNGR
jgi:hypothetical protein